MTERERDATHGVQCAPAGCVGVQESSGVSLICTRHPLLWVLLWSAAVGWIRGVTLRRSGASAWCMVQQQHYQVQMQAALHRQTICAACWCEMHPRDGSAAAAL